MVGLAQLLEDPLLKRLQDEGRQEAAGQGHALHHAVLGCRFDHIERLGAATTLQDVVHVVLEVQQHSVIER